MLPHALICKRAGPGSSANVANSTFTANPAGQLNGGSIYENSGAHITIKNSIVGGGSNGSDCAGAALDSTSLANLDVSGGCGASFSDYPLDQLGLGAPDFYGGQTKTVPLLHRSPALIGGSPATCTTAPVNNVDQRGHVRIDLSHPGPGASTCSIGAFEYLGVTYIPRISR